MNRQYDMDWIRVLATMAVFLYHISMFFNPFPWHVKNNDVSSTGVLIFTLFNGAWIMPIFFVVSGISVFYALERRKGGEFLKERFIRLGIPLLLGVFILSPPQVFIERLTNNQFSGSLFEFFPHYFDGLYLDIGGVGNFAFVGLHLWYCLVLLVFSLLTFPLFKNVRGHNVSFRTIHFVLLPLGLFVISLVDTVNLGGWDLHFYLVLFLYGYYYFSKKEFKKAVKVTFPLHLITAIVTSIVYIVLFIEFHPQTWISEVIFDFVRVVNCWSWLLSIFNLADKYLSFTNVKLKYAGEASMPFYIIHQPVIVLLGYSIYDLSWSIPVKVIFLTVLSFLTIMFIFHFIIRPNNVLRLLFGIKSKKVNMNSEIKQQM
ncbi:acyltransferase family protein [Robertmurraya mangrovi]|nr:acyltransferase family protein [Bacillus sp. 31A1R]